MLFSSLTFIFYFMPLCILCYFVVPKKYMNIRNLILLIFSLIFYSWGEPKYIFVMLLTIFIAYVYGILVDRYRNIKKLKLLFFTIGLITIIGELVYFKYINFISTNIALLIGRNIEFRNIVLPLGISFYTFQILSYLIDLYRGKIKLQKNPFHLALYITFFPQLIAGPIVKYDTIEREIDNRKVTMNDIVYGLERFIIGLGKKVIIANNMAVIADQVYDNPNLYNLSGSVLILGILAYTYQIYFDFSGYSDMAIGLSRIFGFHFLENFNYPYIANTISDFWKRWHISLTSFFREYIYIPLGGNRVNKLKWIFNMFIIWLLTGLWHGADYNFIIWGLYYFVLLLIERTILKSTINKIPKIFRLILTFTFVNIGWLIFRVNSLSDLKIILSNLFNNSGTSLQNFLSMHSGSLNSLLYIILAIIFSTPIINKLDNNFKDNYIYNLLKKLFVLIIFALSITFLVSSNYNPFIYFRF